MGKAFVYNAGGEKSTPPKLLDLSFGLFFDGTLNNRRNTELRLLTEDNDATPKEKEIYKKNSARETMDKIFNNPANNSYLNDYSNIARQSMCCLEEYAVYIEGIGTEDEKEDSTAGFMLGSGTTGIRGKVRKGCEKLAKEIIKIKGKEEKTELKNLTLDVFGFSRGAAAARNFVYEVNVKKAYPAKKSKYITGSTHLPNDSPHYVIDSKDSDGELVNHNILENEQLPDRGHLGYKLLESGVFSKEELENLTVTIRFLGVYDTVSSYAEVGNNTIVSTLKGAQGALIDIFNDVEELQLNNLGRVKKAVHFTAMNEHRENFSLTRLTISKAVEKAFPGVHSDIGGGYESGKETIDEIETSNHNRDLKKYKEQLQQEYWWTDKELEIPPASLNLLDYKKLTGSRTLKKEYSYIPLHFMNLYYGNMLGKDKEKILAKNVVSEYPIDKDSLLVKAKKILNDYVVTHTNTNTWEFITDEELTGEHEKKIQQKIKDTKHKKLEEALKKQREEEAKKKAESWQEQMERKKAEWDRKERERMAPKSDNLKVDGYKQRQGTLYNDTPAGKDKLGEQLDEKAIRNMNKFVISEEQDILRTLRHGYLHWSANRDWMGMDPVTSRKRVIYPLK